jgi:hypothetical protein
MPDGSPAAGSVLPPAPCAVGVGEVPGAVPISGLTNCVSEARAGGVDVPPPAGGADDPPADEAGGDALFEPPHAANSKVKATPTVLFRILFNMILPGYWVIFGRCGCAELLLYFAGFKSRP